MPDAGMGTQGEREWLRTFIIGGGYEVKLMGDGNLSSLPMDEDRALAAFDALVGQVDELKRAVEAAKDFSYRSHRDRAEQAEARVAELQAERDQAVAAMREIQRRHLKTDKA